MLGGVGLRRAAVLSAATAALAAGYIRNQTVGGAPLFQASPGNLRFFLAADAAPGLVDEAGQILITADSDPAAALIAAQETWAEEPFSVVAFAPPGVDPAGAAMPDGSNIVTFSDTPENRSITSGAIAVTRLFFIAGGRLRDTDIVFNPELTFATTLDPEAFDIQALLTHELGHALGMDHSSVAAATMFATTSRANPRPRMLTEDDRAFLRDAYPTADERAALGRVTGTVFRRAGGTVSGALLAAVERNRNVIVAAIADAGGRFAIRGLPPGDYLLYAEPLDGPAERDQLGADREQAETSFRTSFLGGESARGEVRVVAGGESPADLVIEPGEPPLNILGLGAAAPGRPRRSLTSASLARGGQYEITLFGPGLDDPSLGLESIEIFGDGLSLSGGALRRGVIAFTDGSRYPSLSFGAEVAADAPPGLLSVAVRSSQGVSAYTGGVEIEPVGLPRISAGGVVNGASFRAGPVAPGSIVSIFGLDLASTSDSNASFDPASGRLRSELGGVNVAFNGIPAPLFFVSPTQINAQVPTEAASGGASLSVQTFRDGVAGPIAEVAARPRDPALFTLPLLTQAAAIDAAGSLISEANPASADETIVLFGTGQGPTSPPTGAGEPAGPPLREVAAPVQATIGGRLAAVSFAGLTPGFVGLFQMNVVVPEGLGAGDAAVRISIGGVVSPAGPTVSVR